MSGLPPRSPAKLERVERHLSRQRGAGVRNLATSFGFSFALAAAPTSEEPPTKRRKSTHQAPDEPVRASGKKVEARKDIAAEIKPKSEVKQKGRRRFEDVEEDERVVQRDEGKDCFPIAVKKKGRPRKKDVPTEVEKCPAASAVPLGRPRRQAAASALAKVTEGFVEEETSIDKKRRDPEPEKAARRGRKKAAPPAVTETIKEPVGDDPPGIRRSLVDGKPHSKEKLPNMRKTSHAEAMSALQDRRPSTKSTAGKNQQPASMIEHSEGSNPTVPRKVRATRHPKRESRAPPAKDSKEIVPVPEYPLQEGCHGGRAAEKRTKPLEQQKSLPRNSRLATGKAKTQVKPIGMAAKTQGVDEDVGWLFETTEKRSLPSRRQTQRKAAATKAQRATLPDVDLDEMLSNIASWAPSR